MFTELAQHRQLQLAASHAAKRFRKPPAHPSCRDAPTRRGLAQAELLRAVSKQRGITQTEKQPPLIELRQVRQEIRKQFVLALHERGQRRQELIIAESTQSIAIPHRSAITR